MPEPAVSRHNEAVPRVHAVLAALLFGAAPPLSKVLVGDVHPIVLAGLLYLGAGLAALAILAARRLVIGRGVASFAPPFEGHDALVLSGAVLAGGVVAPIAMMYGLRVTPAATASLLLNFEVAATALLAAALFGEALGPRVVTAIAAITVGGCLLAWHPGEPGGVSLGVLGILVACVLWGVDNNLTRIISGRDVIAIVCVKGLAAGAFSLGLGVAVGAGLPTARIAAFAVSLGSVSFGASMAFYVWALGGLGAARTGALFGIAPFFGALLSLVMFRDVPIAPIVTSVPFLAAGAALLLREAHRHPHQHPEMVHEHQHSHDDGHHDHEHGLGEVPTGGYHSHRHRHEATSHDHPHSPDLHHRHDHPR